MITIALYRLFIQFSLGLQTVQKEAEVFGIFFFKFLLKVENVE